MAVVIDGRYNRGTVYIDGKPMPLTYGEDKKGHFGWIDEDKDMWFQSYPHIGDMHCDCPKMMDQEKLHEPRTKEEIQMIFPTMANI